MFSYDLLQQRNAEQIIDIPVPRRRRGQGGLQGSHPGQSSTAPVVEQVVDIPVRGGLRRSVLRSRWLTFQFLPVEVLHSLTLVLQALPQFRVESLGMEFFRTFLQNKKVRVRQEFECECAPALELMDAGGFCGGGGGAPGLGVRVL